MRRALVIGALCGAAACAHGPSPEARRSAYFTCSTTLDEAASSLKRAGHAVVERQPGAPVATGWAEYEVSQDRTKQQLTLRLSVASDSAGVQFTITEAGPQDVEWTEVTERQVAADPYRALLNKLRRDICGESSDYFTAPD